MKNRKHQVLLTAQKLFIEKGFAATSVQDIINESKISKGTFYNYFSSKNECIISIIDNAKEETDLKRRELLIHQDISNKDILIKQLIVRMEVYKERNLVPIFLVIFHSQDSELRDIIKNNHYEEVKWLSKRIIDVYGAKSRKYSVDCAILLLGMIQQMQHPWTVKSKEVSSIELINYVINRLDSIMADLKDSDEVIIDTFVFNHFYDEVQITKAHVIKLIQTFKETNINELKVQEIELMNFIIDELKSDSSRRFLLETVVNSFSNTMENTAQSLKVKEISSNIWQVIDSL